MNAPEPQSAPPKDRGEGPLGPDLEAVVREKEALRRELIRHRRQKLLLAGAAVSLGAHLLLMIILASIYRLAPGGVGVEPVQYDFAILQEEDLVELQKTAFEELTTEAIEELEDLRDESAVELEPNVPAVEMNIATSGSMPTLGGAGEGEGFGLSGGGAGTSFFGVSSSGQRFAYIVDKSGSMSDDSKMDKAKREMARSIQSLADYAQFYVVMFSNGISFPHFQDGWMRAKPSTVARILRWLSNEVDPGGGTEPRDAFIQVFSLETRPDVIFFLTDGEISGFTAAEVAEMNGRGKRVVINTIAFGNPASQDLLKDVATQSGGMYRYVDPN